jgi:hypothetical protein
MGPTAASLRPFGRAGDLEVPFDRTPLPFLVTALLARCSETADPEGWWAQPVGTRIASLVRLAAVTDGREAVDVHLRCPVPDCGTTFEIALPVDALGDGSPPAEPIAVALPAGGSVTVRLPTGEDQRRWVAARYRSSGEAVNAIAGALVVEGQLSADDGSMLTAIGAALADHDPLVHFTVACNCPSCAGAAELPIDLEALAIGRLAAVRRALIEDVHVLASAYGWTESEILAIAPERRARYRELIEGIAG